MSQLRQCQEKVILSKSSQIKMENNTQNQVASETEGSGLLFLNEMKFQKPLQVLYQGRPPEDAFG